MNLPSQRGARSRPRPSRPQVRVILTPTTHPHPHPSPLALHPHRRPSPSPLPSHPHSSSPPFALTLTLTLTLTLCLHRLLLPPPSPSPSPFASTVCSYPHPHPHRSPSLVASSSPPGDAEVAALPAAASRGPAPTSKAAKYVPPGQRAGAASTPGGKGLSLSDLAAATGGGGLGFAGVYDPHSRNPGRSLAQLEGAMASGGSAGNASVESEGYGLGGR